MSKLTVALDCDGIIFSCNEYVLKLAERITQRRLPPPDEHVHFEFDKALGLTKSEMGALNINICDPEMRPTRDMPWIPGAVAFVRELFKRQYDVFFLTSHWRGCHSWVTDREERLCDTFGPVDVVFAHNKTRAEFDVLVDDRLENVEAAHAKIYGGAILLDQPWNRSREPRGVPRAKNYAEVLAILKECEHKP